MYLNIQYGEESILFCGLYNISRLNAVAIDLYENIFFFLYLKEYCGTSNKFCIFKYIKRAQETSSRMNGNTKNIKLRDPQIVILRDPQIVVRRQQFVDHVILSLICVG